MDILDARPQYKIIINAGCKLPLEIHEHTQLEIGFGNGLFTVQYAKMNPDIMLYGLEISGSCVLRCARRAADLENLRILCTDARFMLRELFPDESLEKIIMNFPCPWSSNSAAHRRVTAKDFSDSLATVLKIGGIFEFLSDDENYSREVWGKLSGHEALSGEIFELNPHRPVKTKYERKWLDEGKNIHRLIFRKVGKFTSKRRIDFTEDFENMHLKISSKISEQDITNMNGISGQKSGAFWKFGRYFSGINSGSNDEFLLEAFTSDEEFEQRFYFKISQRDDGTLIKIDRFANAFLTPAVRSSIEDLSQRLNHEGR